MTKQERLQHIQAAHQRIIEREELVFAEMPDPLGDAGEVVQGMDTFIEETRATEKH
jgi:hypothetical protein